MTEDRPTQRPRRSPVRRALAFALILVGTAWILQGLGILTAGRSFMIGDSKWALIGAVFVVLGVGLAVRARR